MPLFGKEPTMKEKLRQNDKEFRSMGRDIEREQLHLKRQEQQIMSEMKKAAKDGNEGNARILAKSLIQCRKQNDKLLQTKAQMMSVQTKTHTMASTQKITGAMCNAAKIVGAMNSNVSLQQTQQTMQEFAKQSEMMSMKEEMIGEGIDDAFGDEDLDEETNAVVDQVLDEIGVNLKTQLAGVPSGRAGLPTQSSSVPAQESDDNALDELSARMARLRGNASGP